jgi:hypothetical protein
VRTADEGVVYLAQPFELVLQLRYGHRAVPATANARSLSIIGTLRPNDANAFFSLSY